MKKYFFSVTLILICSILHPITLKEAYDSAPSQAGYDKYLELETGDYQKVKKMVLLK
jgi:hypothetical protein